MIKTPALIQSLMIRDGKRGNIYPLPFFVAGICKVVSLIIIMFVSWGTSYSQTFVDDTVVVAHVNGEPVTKREFMHRAEIERSGVIRQFRILYGSVYDTDFWHTPFNGKTPSDVLIEKTLDTLAKIKIQQMEARKLGLIRDISYPGFLKLWENENKRRLEARRDKIVIYGPVQYSEDVYYSYVFTNMANQLKSALGEKDFAVADEQLRGIYERDKDKQYGLGFYTQIRSVSVKYKMGKGIPGTDKIRTEARHLLSFLADSINVFETGIASLPDKYRNDSALSFVIEDVVYNDSVYSGEEDLAIKALIKETAKTMAKGTKSHIIEFPGTLCMIQVTEKKALGYRSYTDCKNTIRAALLSQLYSQFIEDRFLNAKVTINMEIVGQLNF
jgi:hypothetical protein